MRLHLVLLVLGAVVPGCGRLTPPLARHTPAATISRYVQALERDDPLSAYRLLAPPTQQRIAYRDFADTWRKMARERAGQAASLRRSQGPGPAQALIHLGDGARLVLQQDGQQRWRLAEPVPGRARPQTPEEALRLLLQAAEQRSYPAVMRLFSPVQRRAIEAELTERIERLRDALTSPIDSHPQVNNGRSPPGQGRPTIEVKGDQARFQYDPRFYIDLRKDSGRGRPDDADAGWYIQDLN
jgi:hypothetical protein